MIGEGEKSLPLNCLETVDLLRRIADAQAASD